MIFKRETKIFKLVNYENLLVELKLGFNEIMMLRGFLDLEIEVEARWKIEDHQKNIR